MAPKPRDAAPQGDQALGGPRTPSRAPRRADEALAEGDRLAGEGRWFAAIWAFQEALERRPGEFTARFGVASALLRLGLYDAARAEFRTLSRLHPESGEVRLALAQLERAVGRPEQALTLLKGVSATDAAELQIERGRAAHAAGRFDAARAAYEALIGRDPANVEGHYRLGRLLLAIGEVKPAAAILRRASLLAPEDADVAWAYGVVLRHSGTATEQAEAALASAIRLQPAHAPALRELAALATEGRRFGGAAELLTRAIRADPRAAEPHEALARVMAALGRERDAEYHRGLALLAREQPSGAITLFRRMARTAPDALEPVLMASIAFVKMRQYVPAVRGLARARERLGDQPDLMERLAMLSVLTHDPARARKLCVRWRAAQPGDPRPAWILGRIAANDGEREKAVRLYEESLRLRPRFLDVKGDLARTLMDQGGPERLVAARALLEEALAQAPGLADLHLQLALTLRAEGRHVEGLDRAFQSLERDPSLVAAYAAVLSLAPRSGGGQRASFYGRLLRAARERAARQEVLETRLWEPTASAESFRAMAWHLLANGDLIRAGYHLDNALSLRPTWTAVRQERAMVRRLSEVE